MFPLQCVLVAITVVGLIIVSVVRTEARDRQNQARCSWLHISFLGGTQLAATQVWFPFSPTASISTSKPHQTSEDRRKPACFTFIIQVSQIATDSARLFIMKSDVAEERSVISQGTGRGAQKLMDHTSPLCLSDLLSCKEFFKKCPHARGSMKVQIESLPSDENRGL